MNSIETVAGVIQLAVAPVFLLAGIAGLLGVLSTRLARIIDRARVIERRVPQAKHDEQRALLRRETTVLWRRIALINWAIRLCVAGALAICLVIIALFLGEFVAFNIAVAVAVLFVSAMVLIVAGLMFLLGEVSLATRHMREGMEIALEDGATDASQQLKCRRAYGAGAAAMSPSQSVGSCGRPVSSQRNTRLCHSTRRT
jgi:type IV secretory pathway VirB6-like protein